MNVGRVLPNLGSSKWIVILFAWALCVRLLFNILVGFHANLSGDELEYNSYAVNLVTRHEYISGDGGPYWPPDMSRRPPLFPFYLALVYEVFGFENYMAVRLGQSVIGALLCVVLMILAQRSFDNRTGLVAGFIASIYPYLVYFSSQLRPEPLYFVFVYSSAIFFLAFINTGYLVPGIVAGILWGVAALTHSDWLLTMPLFFLWGLLTLRNKGWPARLKLASIFVIVVVVISPWTWRNYLVHGAFVPISTNLGMTIAGSNNPAIIKDPIMIGQWLHPEDMVQFVGDLSELSEVERDRVQVQYALNFIRQNPGDFLTLGLWRLVRHWHFYHPLTHHSPLELATLGFYFVVLALAVGAIIRLLMLRQVPGLVFFALTLFILTNAVAFTIRSGTRFRLLMDPCLIILASYLVASTGSAVRRAVRSR
jgi:4-amino-4-deoxy-L-arabinose transferase-like glycosyltransferase